MAVVTFSAIGSLAHKAGGK